ncbi:hypothetical protein FACS1894190_12590 [Spirochaetia bacterium]|nr:hypothetical protein FACS1894190_12590 [Spirochaetia bacterium]
MKNIFVKPALLTLVSFAVFVSCVTASAPPQWAATGNGVQLAYPRSVYIAQKGEGGTRKDAEMAATVELSRYFTREVTDKVSRKRLSGTQNGVDYESTTRDTDTLIKSETNLIAVRLSQPYNANKNEWAVVAYIDREEAWEIYLPRVEKAAGVFSALHEAAEKESDDLKKYFAYMACAAYSDSVEFLTITLFAQTLYPAKAEATYRVVNAQIEELPQKIIAARQKNQIFINCPADSDGIITTAFSKSFNAEGFTVITNRAATSALCEVLVDEGVRQTDTGTFYYPTVTAVLSGKTGALWTYNANATRQGAVTPDVAKRRAYTALAQEIEKSFSSAFNNVFKNKDK